MHDRVQLQAFIPLRFTFPDLPLRIIKLHQHSPPPRLHLSHKPMISLLPYHRDSKEGASVDQLRAFRESPAEDFVGSKTLEEECPIYTWRSLLFPEYLR